MSLSKVIYTKDWNDPSDFPTIETSESQVRADLQDLHDQIRASVNLVIDELESTNTEYSGASQIGVSTVEGLSATNVQAAIAALKALIGEAESTASEDLSEHTTDTDNPHQVSGDQVPISVEGITATKVEAAIAEIKSLLDQKAEISDLDDYETVTSANSHFVDVSLNVDTGVITFTTQNGSTKTIDTALETIPVSMRFFEVTTETGSKAYYLGIYDDDDELISSTNVSSLFNEFEVSDTATIDMSQTTDSDGVKTISCSLKTASVAESHLSTALKQKLETLEGLLTTAVTGVQDSSQIALSLSNTTTGKKIQATIKAKSIGAEQMSDDYTASLTEAKTAAQTAATNAAASESNANTYQGKAKSYAVGDETARAGSSTDNASYYKDKAAEKATESKSYAVGGTGSRTNENTDNAKYYKEQAEAAKVSAVNANSTATQKAEDATTQATLSKSYAQGGTGTRTGEDTNNAKYYMEQAALIVGEAGLGDMLKATYDPQSKSQDIFAYADTKANSKITKVTTPTAGHIPKLTSDGQLEDSGVSLGELEVTIDSTLSSTSENPVQNKVINAALDDKGNADIITTTNTSVPVSAWTADTTYDDFPFRAAIAITGCTADYKPDVTFSLADSMSGNFAPIAETYAGGVYIYAAETPETAVTVPTITLLKQKGVA